MPRNPSLPVILQPLSPLPNIRRSVQQKIHPWRVRFGSQCIHRGKSVRPETVRPKSDLSVVATFPAGLVVVDDQAASRSCKFPKLAQQDALSCLAGAMAEPVRLKPIVWINEHEIGVSELLDGPGEPFLACGPTLGDGTAGRDHFRCEDSARQDAGIFECPNVPSVGGHDLSEDIEQVWVEVSPLLWTLKIADMPTISVVDFVGIKPPCDAGPVSGRERTEDAELQIVNGGENCTS